MEPFQNHLGACEVCVRQGEIGYATEFGGIITPNDSNEWVYPKPLFLALCPGTFEG